MTRRRLVLAKALFFVAAAASLALSVYLWFGVGSKEQGLFVGLWVPSILAAGGLALAGKGEQTHA